MWFCGRHFHQRRKIYKLVQIKLNKEADLKGQHFCPVSYCLTLFTFGGPCHLSNFKQCSGDLLLKVLSENIVLIHYIKTKHEVLNTCDVPYCSYC